MSENKTVEIPFGDDPAEQATLLLAAAEDSEGGQESVRTGSGVFIVPKDVADKSGVAYEEDTEPEGGEQDDSSVTDGEQDKQGQKSAAKKPAKK